MVQFYFLSIVANLLGGMALSADYLSKKVKFMASWEDFFVKQNVRITIGFSALIVGILKLIVKPIGWAVPFAGDLLPALAGIVVGVALLVDFFKKKTETEVAKESIEKVEKVVITYRVPLGIGSIVIALLHFFIPGALFL